MLIARRELLRLGQAALAWRLLLAGRPRGGGHTGGVARRARAADARVPDVARTARGDPRGRGHPGHRRRRALPSPSRRGRRRPARGGRGRARGAEDAQARLDQARKQLADADGLMVEAQALQRLAALPPVPPGAEQSTPEVLEYHGVSAWTLAQVASLDRFFSARFGRPLPVSALGQTPRPRPARLRPPERRGRRGPPGQRRGPRPPRSSPRARHPVPRVPGTRRGRLDRRARARRRSLAPHGLTRPARALPPEGRGLRAAGPVRARRS